MKNSHMLRGRSLGPGDRAVHDVDSLLPGEAQISANRTYIAYGLKLGIICVLNISTGLCALLRGHTRKVTDMDFFAEQVDRLASASVDGRICVWKIDEGTDEKNKPQITERIQIAIQIVGDAETYHPRICWHSHKQEILFDGIGNYVLKIDTEKLGRGKDFSREEPLKCSLDKLIVGVYLVGKHDGDVTVLSFSQCRTIRLASASKDGVVKIWDDGKEAPLSVLIPHDGLAVSSVSFLAAPERQDHINLVTAGPLNRELKLWASANEGSEEWRCTQTLELIISHEDNFDDAFFNHMAVLPQARLILLANAKKKNSIYAVHLEYGTEPASTWMNYIADFTVAMPILSLTGIHESKSGGEQVLQMYCVDTMGIQRYTLELSRCWPDTAGNSAIDDIPPQQAALLPSTESTKDSSKSETCSTTTIDSLTEDLILETFMRLPSVATVVRAACSCRTWKKAVASSPKFRRLFLESHSAPLLGLFFDPPSMIVPAFPTFVPARNHNLDLPTAVRRGDFFTTILQNSVVPPNWIVSDVRSGHMLLMNREDLLLTIDPLLGESEGCFNPHDILILMDYEGTEPRVLKAHIVCDEVHPAKFNVICLAHDRYRVRAAVYDSSSGISFALPWFVVLPRQNELDEEGGWLDDGVQAGKAIYWFSRNHDFVVKLDIDELVFSVKNVPELQLDNLASYCFGESHNGNLLLAYIDGERIVFKCSDNVEEPWEITHEYHLRDFALHYGEIRVASVRNGIAYIMASHMFDQYGMSCWFATYRSDHQKLEKICQWTTCDLFQPFHLPWPKFLCNSVPSKGDDEKKFEPITADGTSLQIYTYQLEVKKNPQNYFAWQQYINLVETVGDREKIREVFERATSNLPLQQEKSFWGSFIGIWKSYARFEEEDAGDIQRARDVYNRCLQIIPHEDFTFSIIWILSAEFEIRQQNVDAARHILRTGIDTAPTGRMYEKLIDIEEILGNFDICRDLYENYVAWSPANCYVWIKYAEMEHGLGEQKRARAIYERAVQEPTLDLPLVLWKDYLIFEISENEIENARTIFEIIVLLSKNDVMAWTRYAQFEADLCETCVDQSKIQQIKKCRSVFKRAIEYYSSTKDIKETNMLIEEWIAMEKRFGNFGDVTVIQKMLSKRQKRKRSVDGSEMEKKRKLDTADEN